MPRIQFLLYILSSIPCLLPKTLDALDFKTFCFQGQHRNLFFLQGENEVPIEINSYRISKKYTYKGESPIVIYTHVKDEEGKRPRQKIEDVWVCDLGKENDWPADYTYLDKFLEDVAKKNNGDIVFFAISVEDYELMSYNMQELRRYIREVQEVIVYYRNVTIKTPQGDQDAIGLKVEKQ